MGPAVSGEFVIAALGMITFIILMGMQDSSSNYQGPVGSGGGATVPFSGVKGAFTTSANARAVYGTNYKNNPDTFQ